MVKKKIVTAPDTKSRKPSVKRAPRRARQAPLAPSTNIPPAVDSDASRRVEVDAEIATATKELNRLQEERLLVEAKLAAHTGIFGSGFLKMRDPENEQILSDINALIATQEHNLSESRRILGSLKGLVAN